MTNWNGQLPKDWQLRNIEDFCKTFSGGTPSRARSEFFRGAIKWVKIRDMSRWIITDTEEKISESALEHSTAKIFPRNTVLVSIFATIGAVAILGTEAATNQAIAGIIPDPQISDYRYLAYYLEHIRPDLERISRGVAQRNINQRILRSTEVALPPLDTQRALADVLDKARNLLERRKNANQLLNKIIQSAFLKVFGTKIPNSKIGKVAVYVSSGITPLGGEKTYVKEGILFVRSQNVHMNTLRLDDAAHISGETHNQMRRTWVKNGDILLNITGASLGRVAVYRGPNDKANVNQHVCIIRVDQSKVLPEYVSFYLSSPWAQKQIWMIQAGASRQALNYNQVKSLNIYIPTIDEQSKFVAVVKRIGTLKDKQIQTAKEINRLFQSLIHKAFRGELILEETGILGN